MPITPLPAATAVLLRNGSAGLEVLLLRRNRSTRFVPGAYVFPGGTVDAGDAASELSDYWKDLSPAAAAKRLGLSQNADPPALAYYSAAVRETFEETGLLVASHTSHSALPTNPAREALLAGNTGLAEVVSTLATRFNGAAIEYIGHWVTPTNSKRRYDTRFFVVKVAAGAKVTWDEREMSEALWLTPADALARQRDGNLPLIYPTLYTLQQLAPFTSAERAFSFYQGRPVPRIQPDAFISAEELQARFG